MPLQVQSPAPTFKANAYFKDQDEFREVALEDYKDRWLCLYFYPMAFSHVCPTEIEVLSSLKPRFEECNCELIACSCDTHLVLKAWCHHEDKLANLNHPLMADVTKRVAMDYGVLLPEKGIALRGTFLIDPHGVLRWQQVNDLFVGRNTDEILRVLEALRSENACPCNWKREDATVEA